MASYLLSDPLLASFKNHPNILHNAPVAKLVEEALFANPSNPDTLPSYLTSSGALLAFSGILLKKKGT